MVQSLYDIALWRCIQLASRITDVGDIPYHLVRPVLKKLNAKQLLTVEQNSPSIAPESDELWALLIERDFPDRPAVLKKAILDSSAAAMPNKSQYEKYTSEREQLRASSAQRLRSLTSKLQREKSKNSIVPIQGIIREPTFRRRTPGLALVPGMSSKYGSKSILGKAMKDVQHRQLMFGGTQRNERKRNFLSGGSRYVAPPRPAGFLAPLDGPTGIYLHQPIGRPASPPRAVQKVPEVRSGSVSPSRTASSGSAETSPLPESRKRPQVSIFISSKKMHRAPRIQPETKPKGEEGPTLSPQKDRSPIRKAGRSSIFH